VALASTLQTWQGGAVRRSVQARIDVAATPETIFGLVTDVTRVGQWSGECRGCEWIGGVNGAAVGARFRCQNRRGAFRWNRTSEVVEFEPPQRFVWRTMPIGIYPDSSVWTITTEPNGADTTVTLSFEIVRIPAIMAWAITTFFPPHRDRTQDLADDLGRLKALVEERAVADAAG
jgi:uncharacterized protein YndB with AHSA1/START domain